MLVAYNACLSAKEPLNHKDLQYPWFTDTGTGQGLWYQMYRRVPPSKTVGKRSSQEILWIPLAIQHIAIEKPHILQVLSSIAVVHGYVNLREGTSDDCYSDRPQIWLRYQLQTLSPLWLESPSKYSHHPQSFGLYGNSYIGVFPTYGCENMLKPVTPSYRNWTPSCTPLSQGWIPAGPRLPGEDSHHWQVGNGAKWAGCVRTLSWV